MFKYKYVVVDWESWGVEAQSSSKIIACDPFSVREGDECSLQGTDPATKRPMLFQGHVLAIFGEFIHLVFFSIALIFVMKCNKCLVNPFSFEFLGLVFTSMLVKT